MTLHENAGRRWGLTSAASGNFREARSAATVSLVETRSGTRAYLKVTTPEAGAEALAAARRELAFYMSVAPQLPGVASRLLEATDGDEGVAVLIEDAGRVLPTASWEPARWESLAVAVRRVHAADGGTRPEFHHAVELDRAMSRRDPGVKEFWGGLTPPLSGVLTMLEGALPQYRDEAFVHGDLHVDNVLSAPDGEALHIVDWQQCGHGSALADLAFVNVRLAPSGRVAPEAFLRAYAAERGVDLGWVRLGTELAELATYLYVWPPFAAYNTAEGVAAVRTRAAELAHRTMHDVTRA